MSRNNTLVFAAPRYRYLQNVICRGGHFLPGSYEEGRHPNGEIWRVVSKESMERARGTKVLVIGSTDLEDFDSMLACGTELARVASEINYGVIFSRYATQERRRQYGEVVAAKNMCERLSDAPAPGIRKRAFFLDLHAEGMEFYCDRRQITTEHIRCHSLWSDLIRRNVGPKGILGDKVAIGSADLGRKDAVLSLARSLDVPWGLVAKERVSGEETHVLGGVIGDVKNHTVVMLDDMLRGGSTAIEGARSHLAAGATAVWVLITHPDFAGDPLAKLKESEAVSGVIFGDTYPNFRLAEKYEGFAHVIPTGHYLADIWATRYCL